MYGADEAVHLHANRSIPWCVGSVVVVGELAVLRGMNYPLDCAVKTVNSNNGFYMKC